MEKYRAMGPSGPMETMAVSKKKAENNLRYRLQTDCGLSRFQARQYDLSDLKKVD